jgi:ribonuclease HIII
MQVISLRERTPTSFDSLSDLADVVSFLQDKGYNSIPVRSPNERARLQKQGALIVVYTSGTLLVQGSTPQLALDLLCPLATQQTLLF